MRIQTEEALERYQGAVFAAAFSVSGNAHDAEDIVQETFLQYHQHEGQFESEAHIRAWLLRVAVNKSKNLLKAFWRRNTVTLEDYMETLTFETEQSENLFAEVMRLPAKYRVVIHLFYYEDYSVKEIAEITGASEGNVKVRLTRGRKLLRQALKEGWKDDE